MNPKILLAAAWALNNTIGCNAGGDTVYDVDDVSLKNLADTHGLAHVNVKNVDDATIKAAIDTFADSIWVNDLGTIKLKDFIEAAKHYGI